MKIVFLDAATMGDASMDEIAALGEFVCYPSSTAEEARVRAADADVVLLNKVIVDQAFLDACPKLKLVCEAGTGINNINVKLCDERGVIVRNVAGYSTESVAQTAWMHILALAGRAFHYNAYAKDGRYSAKTLGIVGMGAIGQKVAAIGTAFGMKVIYYSTSGTGHCKDYPCVSLDELLTKSDVISIHAPYNERTAGLIRPLQDEAHGLPGEHRPRRHRRRGGPRPRHRRRADRRHRHRRLSEGAHSPGPSLPSRKAPGAHLPHAPHRLVQCRGPRPTRPRDGGKHQKRLVVIPAFFYRFSRRAKPSSE